MPPSNSSKFLREIECQRVEDVDEAVVLDLLARALSKLQYCKDNWQPVQSAE